MARIEQVDKVISATISFSSAELVFIRDLTQNSFKGSDESKEEKDVRHAIWLACTKALEDN